jgi:YgiT-type zinc finger domain-containing protein
MFEPSVCAHCGGSLERKTITHRQPWGDELYEFENVPALVWSQCGEVWLAAEVGHLIDKVIQQHLSQSGTIKCRFSHWQNSVREKDIFGRRFSAAWNTGDKAARRTCAAQRS